MIELFIAILSLYNVQALPNIVYEDIDRSPQFRECMEVLRGSAHTFARCQSLQHEDQTYHIYKSNHCYDSRCVITEQVNLFVMNGNTFEIPFEELFGFYGIQID